MDIGHSFAHYGNLYPFPDHPDVAVRVLWYLVPNTTPVVPFQHPFLLRDQDRLDKFPEPIWGTKYDKPEYYSGPLPLNSPGNPCGTAQEWMGEISYDTWLAGGYTCDCPGWIMPAFVSDIVCDDNSLTIAPTTGHVIAHLNVGHSNTWTATQFFGTLHDTVAADFTSAGQGNSLNSPIVNWTATNATGVPLSVSAQAKFVGPDILTYTLGTSHIFILFYDQNVGASTAMQFWLHGSMLGEFNGSLHVFHELAPTIIGSDASNRIAQEGLLVIRDGTSVVAGIQGNEPISHVAELLYLDQSPYTGVSSNGGQLTFLLADDTVKHQYAGFIDWRWEVNTHGGQLARVRLGAAGHGGGMTAITLGTDGTFPTLSFFQALPVLQQVNASLTDISLVTDPHAQAALLAIQQALTNLGLCEVTP